MPGQPLAVGVTVNVTVCWVDVGFVKVIAGIGIDVPDAGDTPVIPPGFEVVQE